jgi:putative IMPACT (imprinted ancient) family translation regulator
MLQVLRGADLSDVLAVVIRWYGGTKLGKGGLARAYASAVKGALVELAVAERRPTTTLRVSVPYSRVGDLKRLIYPPAIVIVEEVFSTNAEFVLKVESERAGELEEALGGIATEIVIAGS